MSVIGKIFNILNNKNNIDEAMRSFPALGCRRLFIMAAMLCIIFYGIPVSDVQAGTGVGTGVQNFLGTGSGQVYADTCTDQPLFDTGFLGRLDELLQDIVNLVADVLDGLIALLYASIIATPGYRFAVIAASTLFIIFYGVSFMFGFSPATAGQLVIRLVKLGILFIVISPFGFFIFDDIVVDFFADGTNYLINLMVSIGTGTFATFNINGIGQFGIDIGGIGSIGTDVAAPFAILEGVLQKVFSAKMYIIVMAVPTTGPYGIAMFLLMVWAIFNLFVMIIKALEVYLLSLIVRTLLLGLAPIFIVFMLFDRTKMIFMGWVNQLVNFSLQPIILFAFLSFFTVMIETAVDDIIDPVDLCITKYEDLGETPYDFQGWRFMVNGEVYEGGWNWEGCQTSAGGACPEGDFPIEPIFILIFAVLAHIGIQMSKITSEIAAELANSALRLDQVPGSISSYFGNQSGRGANMLAYQKT